MTIILGEFMPLVWWDVSCQLSEAQGLVMEHARPLLVMPVIGSFFQDILLLSHLCNFNTLAVCSNETLLGLQHK